MERTVIGAHRSGRHNGMAEKGGAPSGGNGRTEDVCDRQSAHTEQFGAAGAFTLARHQTDCLFAACANQHGRTNAGALGGALGRGLVIALAVCGYDKGRHKRHGHKYDCKSFRK